MKNIKEYKQLNYRMDFAYEPEDSVYIVKFPELPGCMAHGETPQKALKNAIAVKDEWLEIAVESNWDIPEPEKPSQASGRLTFRPPKYLHERIMDSAKQEGVSINQFLISLIAEGIEKNINADFMKVMRRQSHEFSQLAHLIRLSVMSQQTPQISQWDSISGLTLERKQITEKTLIKSKSVDALLSSKLTLLSLQEQK